MHVILIDCRVPCAPRELLYVYTTRTNTSIRKIIAFISLYINLYITIGHALVLIMVRTLRLPPPWCIYAYMHDYSCYMTVTVMYTDNYNIIIKTVN